MPAFKDYLYANHKRGDHDVVYEISDQDVSGTTKYYGFVNNTGGWIIQAWDTAASPQTFRYKAGTSDYAANFVLRASLTYVLYNAMFGTV